MDKLTIKEIAKMAGVSQTAVSFVINNKNGVSEKTRKRVNEVIERTNFKPSLNSRRLFFKKSYNISIILKETSSPFENLFYFEIVKGILNKSKEYGYNVVFTDIALKDSIVVLPEIIKLNDTDGIIFLQDTEMSILNEIEKRNIPYVVIDSHSSNNSFTSVNADYALSAYAAMKFLIDYGHRNIALIASSFIPDFYLQIFSGFKRALDELILSAPASWIEIDAVDENTAYQCMEKILKCKPLPTAVLCAGDIFAIGAMNCVKDHGFKVPRDISFIAIDDILLSKYVDPKLTTIRIDKVKMGTLAMELIIKKINNEPADNVTVESSDIVCRDSVRKII